MTQKPNIIFITIDALRPEVLESYGSQKSVMPFLDEFARQNIVFKNVFANGPYSLPSFLAILTSTFPLELGGFGKIEKPRVMLNEVLQKAGYFTGLVSSTPYHSSFFGYNRGFDFFYNFEEDPKEKERIRRTLPAQKFIEKSSQSRIYQAAKTLLRHSKKIKEAALFLKSILETRNSKPAEADKVTAKAKEFLLALPQNRPFFFWAQYMDLHAPRLPSQKIIHKLGFKISFLKKFVLAKRSSQRPLPEFSEAAKTELKNLYLGEARTVDEKIEELIGFLGRKNLYENTIIAITSDHGEQFWEHGDLGHHQFLYDELTHVPLILRLPPKKVSISENLVSLMDLAPFLAKSAGAAIPANWRGRADFRGNEFVISETAPWKKGAMLKELDYELATFSIRSPNYKYIKDKLRNREEFYNLQKDPEERMNLLNENLNEEEKAAFVFLKNSLEEHINQL